jgi:hypothetical protein
MGAGAVGDEQYTDNRIAGDSETEIKNKRASRVSGRETGKWNQANTDHKFTEHEFR